MKVYEFGDKQKPAILLLPGTCCYWRSNFGHAIAEEKRKPDVENHIRFFSLEYALSADQL